MTKPIQIHGRTLAQHGEQAIDLIFAELRKAEALHPGWPTDPIHAVAILVEEAREAMKEAINYTYKWNIGDAHTREESIRKLRTELAQTGAMAIRALLYLDAETEITKEQSI